MSLINRHIAEVVTDAMSAARVVALLGPRQSGKSTLARVLADGPLAADYVTLDDQPVREVAAADPVGFVAGMSRTTVIDEVQRVPDVLLAIKSRVDRDTRVGQFLLTGSANLRQIPMVADALPGRVDYLTLWPFSQGELAGRRESFLDGLFEGQAPAITGASVGRQAYSELLAAGGFPEARIRPASARARFFASYIESIVDRDVRDAARVHDPGTVGTLLRVVASRSGALVRYDSVARDLGIDGKTVKSHLDVLERLFLIRIRRPWHVNLGQRQVKAPKVYVSDTGLLVGLVGADSGRIHTDDKFAGAIFETFVATELERQASWAAEALSFWHYREGEREVDVIVERPSGQLIGIEVKAGASIHARDFAGLKHLRDASGDQFRGGAIVYAGERTLPMGDRLWAIPLLGLWGG